MIPLSPPAKEAPTICLLAVPTPVTSLPITPTLLTKFDIETSVFVLP